MIVRHCIVCPATPRTCTCTFVPETPKSTVHGANAKSLFLVRSGVPTIVTTPPIFLANPINSPPAAKPFAISIPAILALMLTEVFDKGKGTFAGALKGTYVTPSVVVAVPVSKISIKDIVRVLVPGFPVTVNPPVPNMLILLAVGGTAPPVLPVSVWIGAPPPPPPAILITPACEILHL